VDLYAIGKKGAGFFKYLKRPLAADRQDIGDKPTADHAASVVEPLIKAYEAGSWPAWTWCTPDSSARSHAADHGAHSSRWKPRPDRPAPDYLLQPDPRAILEQLLPLYVRNMVYRGLVETVAGEQGARRTAMKNATDNAGDIIEYLTRTYNRQRQAAITQEISEIVGGAAALQG
jgi:F-type H+-transporting ATPase subunit gamma